MDTSFYIYNDDIDAILKKCFSFSNGFYATKDPYQRYDRLLYNICLCGIGYRSLFLRPHQGILILLPTGLMMSLQFSINLD